MADDDLKNLPPEERIRRLKKLEEEKKKEIEEAEELIKESETELSERRKWVEKVPIPQVAQEDTQGLGEEGKQVLRTTRGSREREEAEEEKPPAEERPLEEAVAEEALRFGPPAAVQYHLPRELSPQALNAEYIAQLSYTPVEQLQLQMETLYDRVDKRGYMTWEEHQAVQETMSALERKATAVEEGKYSLTEQAAEAALATREVASKLLHHQYKPHKGSDRVRHSWYESSG